MVPAWLPYIIHILAIATYICAACLIVFDPIIRKITKHITTNHNRSTVKEGKRLYIEPIAPIEVSYKPGSSQEPQISPKELQRVECTIAKALRWPRIYFKSGIILNNYKDNAFTFSSEPNHSRWIVAEAFIPIKVIPHNQELGTSQENQEPQGAVHFLEPEQESVRMKSGMGLVISAGKENLRRTEIDRNVMAMYFAGGGNFVPWILKMNTGESENHTVRSWSNQSRSLPGLTPTRMISVNPLSP